MKYLVDHEGVTSFKLFMAYPGVLYSDDGQILRAMQTAAECGAMIMMHAENGIAIDVLVQQAIARGDTDPEVHSYTRPSPLEAEATHRAIVLSHVAGNVPLYIVHMSAGDALNEIAAARHEGRNVFAETCPQYLWLTLEETLGKPGFEGAKWVCSTPVRSKDHDPDYIGQMGHGHQGDLWKGLRMNELAVVSTDHCPFCMKDQKEWGIGNFAAIPNGIGGVEHRMELIYQGVVAGELSLERWVETCCTTPARMFGMYPKKGVIAPGSDADVVVWDPNAKTKIGINDKHHMNMDYSAWEGWVIDGKVYTVLSAERWSLKTTSTRARRVMVSSSVGLVSVPRLVRSGHGVRSSTRSEAHRPTVSSSNPGATSLLAHSLTQTHLTNTHRRCPPRRQ